VHVATYIEQLSQRDPRQPRYCAWPAALRHVFDRMVIVQIMPTNRPIQPPPSAGRAMSSGSKTRCSTLPRCDSTLDAIDMATVIGLRDRR
jgi:hypothetical protein